MSATEWYIVNGDTDAVMRGPYVSVEAAAAARTEIERAHDEDEAWHLRHNLVLVSEEDDRGGSDG